MKPGIRVEKLTKIYPLSTKQRKLAGSNLHEKIAVNGISFAAFEGEIFGILGPNGAGKTTTLRMLATLIKPDFGNAWVGNQSIRSNPIEARKRIGFLTSELRLEEVFTPSYLFDFFSRLHGVEQYKSQRRKKELFSKFDISPYAETKIADLSTGMKQKASLVISIAHNPQIIIFDEPTNGLDLIAAKVVTDFLIELKNEGKTILLSTHIFSLAESVCDRIGIIIDGNMVACDKLDSLTSKASLEQVFFKQYESYSNDEAKK